MLEAAVDRYRLAGYKVDQAHRHLEQRRMALLYPQLPEFETLRDQLDACGAFGGLGRMPGRWISTRLCRSHGFLPAPNCSNAPCSRRWCGR